jgi:hypothetical protein
MKKQYIGEIANTYQFKLKNIENGLLQKEINHKDTKDKLNEALKKNEEYENSILIIKNEFKEKSR